MPLLAVSALLPIGQGLRCMKGHQKACVLGCVLCTLSLSTVHMHCVYVEQCVHCSLHINTIHCTLHTA